MISGAASGKAASLAGGDLEQMAAAATDEELVAMLAEMEAAEAQGQQPPVNAPPGSMAAMAFGKNSLAARGVAPRDPSAPKPQESSKGPGKGKGATKIAMGEQCYIGVVKNFDAERERGYIVCEEVTNMGTGGDVYVHQKILKQSDAAPGDTVAFFLHWSASSGQPQASTPIIRLASAEGYALKGTFKPGPVSPMGGPAHGFLQCAITREFFGRDVYVSKEIAHKFEVGATVAFNAFMNRDKMPNCDSGEGGAEMCDPTWEPTPGDISVTRTDPNVVSPDTSFKGKGKDGKDGGMGKGKDSWGKDGWGKDSWGKDSWGKDGGKGGGMEAMFSMMQQMMGGGDSWGGKGDSWGGKGDGGWGGGKGDWGKGGKDDWGTGGKGDWGKDMGKGKSKDGGAPGPAPTPTGETFIGVIKSFVPATNYGFIQSEGASAVYGPKDIFFSGRYLGECSVGSEIEFDIGLNQKGQPQACAIRPATAGAPAAKRAKMGLAEALRAGAW